MQIKQNKTALITGGNSGIGLALAQKLISENYKVIVTSRSGIVYDFFHPNLTVIKLDVTNQNEIKAARSKITEITHQIDLLVNNAGVASDISLTTPEYDSFKETIDVNLTGLVFFCEEVVSLVRRGGIILNISSEMGLFSNLMSNAPAYRISKAAVNFYTKLLAIRLNERNIKVNAIHPGWVRTKLGGEQAPINSVQSAQLIYNSLGDMENSGQFFNAMNNDRFTL